MLQVISQLALALELQFKLDLSAARRTDTCVCRQARVGDHWTQVSGKVRNLTNTPLSLCFFGTSPVLYPSLGWEAPSSSCIQLIWSHHLRHPSCWRKRNRHLQKTTGYFLREVFKKHRTNCSTELHCTLRESRQTILSYSCNFLTESGSRLIPPLLNYSFLACCLSALIFFPYSSFKTLVPEALCQLHPLLACSWAPTIVLLNCALQTTFLSPFPYLHCLIFSYLLCKLTPPLCIPWPFPFFVLDGMPFYDSHQAIPLSTHKWLSKLHLVSNLKSNL